MTISLLDWLFPRLRVQAPKRQAFRPHRFSPMQIIDFRTPFSGKSFQFFICLLPFSCRRKCQIPHPDICLLLQKPFDPVRVIRIRMADQNPVQRADSLTFQKWFQHIFPDFFILAAATVRKNCLILRPQKDAVALSYIEKPALKAMNRLNHSKDYRHSNKYTIFFRCIPFFWKQKNPFSL